MQANFNLSTSRKQVLHVVKCDLHVLVTKPQVFFAKLRGIKAWKYRKTFTINNLFQYFITVHLKIISEYNQGLKLWCVYLLSIICMAKIL